MSAIDGNALIEAWRAMDDTIVAYQPALPLPPADLDTREPSPWLEPVRFFGEPVRYSSGPLPSNCQHSLASALEDVTRDVRTAAPSAGGAAPAPRIAGTGEVAGDARGHGVGGSP